MSTSVLTVGSNVYSVSGRKTAALLINGFGWDLDSDFWAEISEYCATQTPLFNGPQQVTIVGPTGATVFTGDLVSVQPSWGELGRTWGYRCLGLKYRANWLPIVATDLSGTIRFNVNPATNLDYYVPSLAGLSVGGIISYVLTQHATALTAAGISTDSTTTSGLAALTLVPANEVDVAGDRLWQAMESVLQQWARNIRLVICPTGAGTGVVRVIDVTAGSAETLTCGTDPIDPPLLSRNWTNCATQVICRGLGVIEAGYVSTLDGSLTPAWTSPEQADWTMSAFTNPAGAIDSGTVTTVGSATSVTVSSNNPALTWAINYWSGIQAWISLVNTSLTGLTFTETRPITANTALTAAGTSTITLAYDLQNSGSSAYTSYHIIGTDVPLSSGGLSSVWRLYNVTDPGAWIATHLVRQFPVAMPFVNVNGSSAVLTSFPTCQVLYSGVGGPMPFTIDPVNSQVLFSQPVVTLGNSSSVLAIGGAGVVAPTNIYMMLAYSRGALTTQWPVSGYSGTAYTVAGLARTQTVDVPDWAYAGNITTITPLAEMLQTSTRDTVVEGTIHYKGWYTTPLSPAGGFLMSFAGNGYTTGDEALGASLRSYTVRYLNDGDAGLNYLTEMTVSTRRDPRTGEGYYSHLSQLGSASSGLMGSGFGAIANGEFTPARYTSEFQAEQRSDAYEEMLADKGLGGEKRNEEARSKRKRKQQEAREAQEAAGDTGDQAGGDDQGGGGEDDSGPSNAGTPYRSKGGQKRKRKRDQAQQKALESWMPGAPRSPGLQAVDAPDVQSSMPESISSGSGAEAGSGAGSQLPADTSDPMSGPNRSFYGTSADDLSNKFYKPSAPPPAASNLPTPDPTPMKPKPPPKPKPPEYSGPSAPASGPAYDPPTIDSSRGIGGGEVKSSDEKPMDWGVQ
jgi:hypothetical protein